MDIILLSTFGLLTLSLFIKYAPMHDLKTALAYAKIREQNDRN